MGSRSAVSGLRALLGIAPVALLFLALPLGARTAAPPATSGDAAATPAPAGDAPAAVVDNAPEGDPSRLDSELMPRASKSLLLDMVRTASGFVAVGERGHVLRSDDGSKWTQLKLPTRSVLTSIATADGQLWVGGHDGVILHSVDGGQKWTAQRRDPFQLAEGEHAADHDPRQGAPVLDLHFWDASHGIAIGSHSLMLLTSDGGKTWAAKQALASSAASSAPVAQMEGDLFSAEDLQLDDEADPHFNAVTSAGANSLVIVGERGTLLRSDDAGATWKRLPFPYKGSMFGVLSLGEERLLAYGLRGNVFESVDGGKSWRKLDSHGSTSLMGGSQLEGGGVVLAGANGTVLTRAGADAPLVVSTYRNAAGETPTLSGIAPTGNGRFVVIGDKGADLYQPQ
jgi:photosystem II stability/assembly factor-like uncharacterized protein